MHKLEWMKETIIEEVAKQFCNLGEVNTCELGEAVDIIKDLSEAIYYCTITNAMNEDEEDERKYYGGKQTYWTQPTGHDMVAHDGREGWRSPHEGKSPISRKAYLEAKSMHKDKSVQLQELEKYAQELTSDLIEMIEDATPEEKQFLSNKIATLAMKIK